MGDHLPGGILYDERLIQFVDAPGRRETAVCTENSDSDVLVVQPTDKRMRRNASGPLNRSGYRGIFVQGTMGPRLIVIASV